MSNSLAEIKAMPIAELADLWQQSAQRLAAAKAEHDAVHAGLHARYWRRAERVLRASGRRTGIVHLPEHGYDIAVEFPARDETDQAKIAKAIVRLDKLSVAWREFVKVEYQISRSALKVLPEKVQALLAGTITTRTGKLRFAIRPPAAAALRAAA